MEIEDGAVIAGVLDAASFAFATLVIDDFPLFCGEPIVLISRDAASTPVHNVGATTLILPECLYGFEQSAY
jgi:hypothetical protein